MDPKAVARALFQAIRVDRDLAAVDRLVAPECVEHALAPGDRNGAAGVRALAQSLWQAFPDGRYRLANVIGEGDLVCVHATFTGTHAGHFFGVAPTGRTVAVDTLDVYRVRDGRCVEHWGGFDAGALVSALGLVAPDLASA